MDVLRLYTLEDHAWTVQAMSEALGRPASTVYRVVGELARVGMLEAAGSRYRLGAAFVEFDRLARLTDPLVRHGSTVLRGIVAAAGIPCVGLLSRLHNATVMCIADDAAGHVDFRSSYERGRPMPLTRGATSKVILANLPARRLAALLKARRPGQVAEGDPGTLRAALADIRRRGFAVTHGEVDTGLVGLAAPVGLFASLSLVARMGDLDREAEHRLVAMLVAAASRLGDELGSLALPL